jgi:serine/threonine protein kinase/tetratricopeptide (TPR) repeat protein
MTEREIFAQALEISEAEKRAAFLDRACSGDAALRERVGRLLAERENLGSYLEVPAAAVATTDQPARMRPGLRIDRYRLLEQIGEGGMGTVWVAEQTEPVKRRVALKLIKPGMDSRQVLSRFEAERQALALMDHPNIAKVYDGGMTDEGRPFFVMEYVKGVPITEYCDSVRLSIQERLKLFVQVCQAVQHAHQKGIIHRDLKPSNILVCLYDGVPIPKVIDFGLAKAISQPLTEHTLYTAHGLMVGTPLYMSPEQAEFNNLDIDTRSDIYSLGVILYELLTGSTPLEKRQFKSAAFQEILRLIKEVEPQIPSAKLSGSDSLPNVAAQRSLQPAQLRRLVRGDLDWIVMKSLEKERSRRYETANGMAREIDRYLHDEPVEAGPPSATYRLKKLAHKYRALLSVAATITALLVVGTTVSTWQAIRATRAETAAKAAEHQARLAGTAERAAKEKAMLAAAAEQEAQQQVIAARAREVAQQVRGIAAVESALETAARLQSERNCPAALVVVRQAEGWLAASIGDELRARMLKRIHDLAIAVDLENIRMPSNVASSNYFSKAELEYRRVFQEFGMENVKTPPDDVAALIRGTTVAVELAAGLDDWASIGGSRSDRLLMVAYLADHDPLRQQCRNALRRKDRNALAQLASDPNTYSQSPATLLLLSNTLSYTTQDVGMMGLEVLQRAQSRHPRDFWINYELGCLLEIVSSSEPVGSMLREMMLPFRICPVPPEKLRASNPASLEEAIGFYRVAHALRPENAAVRYRMSEALRKSGHLDEAARILGDRAHVKPALEAGQKTKAQ